ncbi:MAG: hypothetical protein GY782_08550 [Gammaproteobacteria bacterium]|nr:hypothetical protein [Gammaproteobacteria bacterium]
MKFTNKDQFLKSKKVRVEEVIVNEDTYHIAVMSGRSRSEWEILMFSGKKNKKSDDIEITEIQGYREKLLVFCLVNPETQSRIFEDMNEGVEILSGMDSLTLHGLFEKALEVNGLSEKAQKEIRKNS